MSWLYSILIAGLLVSSNAEMPPAPIEEVVSAPMAAVQDVTEKFDQTHPLGPGGRVSVSNVNGPIVVEAWDRNEVRVEATKIADSAETLAEMEIDVDARADRISVSVDHKGWRFDSRTGRDRNRRAEVHFKLSVPRGAVLDEIATVNGKVTVSNFTNSVKVSAVNGDVEATNLKGTVKLSTVNGEVMAEITDAEPGSQLNLSTVNGSVSVLLPSDINATIKADSLNGNITNDFGLPVKKGEYVGRNLHGRLGSGDVQVRLDSVNGPLKISRRQDGRQVNPATNLLSATSGNVPRVNPGVERAISESVRVAGSEAARALETARVELEKVKPALENMKVEIDADQLRSTIQAGLAREKAALAMMANINWASGIPMLNKREKSFSVANDAAVTITTEGCDVSVRTWDRNEVKYVLTERAGPISDQAASITESASQNAVELNVTAERGFPLSGSASPRLEVFVPKGAKVTVRSNSRIRVTGTSGETVITGEDEPIDIRDVTGLLRINAVDSRIRVIGMRGELESVAEDGSLYFEGDFDRLTSRSDSADVTLTLPANSDARIISNVEIETVGLARTGTDTRQLAFGKGINPLRFELNDGRFIVRGDEAISQN
ncbi:MAG TPA: DUF4097 family beta strand repeat-containing protein [Pyrinomonadaceae bacterium]|nr:DUF4097 family beta strand repeat-containing protein [Pyrinomonadaceae bacterium]